MHLVLLLHVLRVCCKDILRMQKTFYSGLGLKFRNDFICETNNHLWDYKVFRCRHALLPNWYHIFMYRCALDAILLKNLSIRSDCSVKSLSCTIFNHWIAGLIKIQFVTTFSNCSTCRKSIMKSSLVMIFKILNAFLILQIALLIDQDFLVAKVVFCFLI